MAVNKFILQGRLTADPEIKQTQSGVSCASFTLAWSEKYKEIETKCFQRCKAWRGTADFLGKYFTKGQELVAVGKMVTEEWEKDGQKRSQQVLVVDEVHFSGKRQDAPQGSQSGANVQGGNYMPSVYSPDSGSSGAAQGGVKAPAFEVVEDNDLPF